MAAGLAGVQRPRRFDDQDFAFLGRDRLVLHTFRHEVHLARFDVKVVHQSYDMRRPVLGKFAELGVEIESVRGVGHGENS